MLRSAERKRSIDLDNIVAENVAFKRLLRMAQKIAHSDTTTVLINGESGMGKDHVA